MVVAWGCGIARTGKGSYFATVGGFGAILLWSTTIAVARSLSEQLGPVKAAAAATTVSGVAGLLSLLGSSRKRLQVGQLPARYLVGCGLLFLVYTLLLYLAIGWARNRQEALEVGLLNYLWPALTLVLALPLLGKKANWVLLPGSLLALGGVFLVMTHGQAVSWQSFYRHFSGNPVAYVLAATAAASWALYSNLARRWAGGREEGAVSVFLPVTALVLLLLGHLVDEPGMWNRRSMLECLFLGVATYFGYALWDNAMRRGNIVMVAAASYFTPFLSTIVSCLYLAVVPGARLWAGCVLLVLGSFLSWRSVSRASAAETAGSTGPGVDCTRAGGLPD